MTIRRRKCPAIIIVRPERKRTPHGDTVPLGGSLVRVERPTDHGVDTVARHEQIGLDTTHGPRRGDGPKGPPPVHSPRARGPRTLSRRWSEPRARAPRGASSVHRHRRPDSRRAGSPPAGASVSARDLFHLRRRRRDASSTAARRERPREPAGSRRSRSDGRTRRHGGASPRA